MANKRWSELSSGQRRGIMFSGTVQVALLIAALADIWRRPKEEIRGGQAPVGGGVLRQLHRSYLVLPVRQESMSERPMGHRGRKADDGREPVVG